LSVLEEFGTGHEEHPPALQGQLGLPRAEPEREHLEQLALVAVKIGEPIPAGAGVVSSVDRPALGNVQVVLKVREKIIGGHEAATEKVPPHPVVVSFGFEPIGKFAMAENMDEQLPGRVEPAGDPAE